MLGLHSWQKLLHSYFHPISLQLRITVSFLQILERQCWKDIYSLYPQGYSSLEIMGKYFFSQFIQLPKHFEALDSAYGCVHRLKSTKNISVKSLLLCFLWSAQRILKSPCTWNLTAALRVSELAQKRVERESWNLKSSVNKTILSSHQ